MFVRGSRSSVSGIGGVSGPAVTQPAGGATDSIEGSGGIHVSPSFTPGGAFGMSGGSALGTVPVQPFGLSDWPRPRPPP